MVLSMDRWRGKVAIVTGASSGIGAAIAQHLVKEGLIVVGLTRRIENVEALAKKLQSEKGKLHAIKTDITREEDILAAFKWIKDNVGVVHILINNAGIVQKTSLLDGDTAKWKKVLETNVLGLCIATREALKVMKENQIDGHVIHINSIMGHTVPNFPDFNVYAASKHAVTALTETLRQELNQYSLRIKITSVSPGLVNTDILMNNDIDDPAVQDLLKNISVKGEDIADGIIYVLSTAPHVQVHELTIKPIGEMF